MHIPADKRRLRYAESVKGGLGKHIDFQRRVDQELVDAGEMVRKEGLPSSPTVHASCRPTAREAVSSRRPLPRDACF
jgi:hypothetical protein